MECIALSEINIKAYSILTVIIREGTHIFNLGSGKGATVLEVIAAFSKASGKVRNIPYFLKRYLIQENLYLYYLKKCSIRWEQKF